MDIVIFFWKPIKKSTPTIAALIKKLIKTTIEKFLLALKSSLKFKVIKTPQTKVKQIWKQMNFMSNTQKEVPKFIPHLFM